MRVYNPSARLLLSPLYIFRQSMELNSNRSEEIKTWFMCILCSIIEQSITERVPFQFQYEQLFIKWNNWYGLLLLVANTHIAHHIINAQHWVIIPYLSYVICMCYRYAMPSFIPIVLISCSVMFGLDFERRNEEKWRKNKIQFIFCVFKIINFILCLSSVYASTAFTH